MIFLSVLLLTWGAAAQPGAQSQTSAGASSSAKVNANKGGVKAKNDTSVSASQQTNANSNSIAAGTTLNAVLTKSIDSRKAKEGDEVTAKSTSTMKAEGERPIPKGTKLIGHITKANARAKGDSESALGIVFDRAEVGKGREVPIHAVVQALAATSTSSMMAANEEPITPTPDRGAASGNTASSGGGLVGGTVAGVGKTVDSTVNASGNAAQQVGAGAGNAVGSASGTINGTAGAATATLSSTSQGVVGLPGYSLDAAAANATQGSIITSTGKSVKLDSGTQMVLRVVND